MKNDKISRIAVWDNAFIIQWVEADIFNQIKGKQIDIFVENDKISHVEVDANAESIYYTKDEKEGYIGGNRSASGHITIYFDDGKIDRLKLTNTPEATFTPMKQLSTASYRLDGFNWQWEIKPKDKYDVIRNCEQYEQFIETNKLYYEK
jgi:hypothetical protein